MLQIQYTYIKLKEILSIISLNYNNILSFHFILFKLYSKFYIIRNIRKISKDEIEITRSILSEDLYNNLPYDTEKIFIKRKTEHLEDPVFVSLYEDRFKKKVVTISADSLYSVVVKFKTFRNPNEVLFFQNIFHYKCILELHEYYKQLGKIPSKKEFNLKSLYYHEYIKNLI